MNIYQRKGFALIIVSTLIIISHFIIIPEHLKTYDNVTPENKTYVAPDLPLSRSSRAGTPWPMHLNNPLHTSFTTDYGPITNEVQWYSQIGNERAYSSPAVVDDLVFVGSKNDSSSYHDFMNAYYADNGTLAWRTETYQYVSGGYGVTCSPAVDNGYVFFGADRIYCLYANNGTIKWTVPTGNTNWGDGSPTVANGKVFIGGSDRELYCIDQDTGNVIWTFQTLSTGENNHGLYAAPVVTNGLVYLAACDGYLYQINETQPLPIATANHTFEMAAASYSSPVVVNGRVYLGCGYTITSTSNRFYCLDATDLSLIWEFYPGSSTSFFSSAGFYNDRIYIGSINGNLYCLDYDGFEDGINDGWAGESLTGLGDGDLIWYTDIGGTWSSPAITNNRLYIGSMDNYLYCLNLSQTPGEEEYCWRYNTKGIVDSSPAISGQKVYIVTHGNGGRLYCIGSPVEPTIDEIIIRTAPNGVGSWVGDSTYIHGDTHTFYAAGYNTTLGYLSDVAVGWSVAGGIGSLDPSLGTSTNFTAETVGQGTITINFTPKGIINGTGVLTIIPRIVLKQGWNLISIPLIQGEQNLDQVLVMIEDYYDAVQCYDSSDINDPWKHTKIDKPFGNDLSELNETMGFWIYITEPGDTIFLYNGIYPTENQSVILHKGWNLVGYPSLTSYNRTKGLNNLTFDTHVDTIWTYNAATQTWKEIGPDDYFEMGRGYWIHAKVECVWEVPL